MATILDAFITLSKTPNYALGDGEKGNRIQIVGGGLEEFIKDLFADTLNPTSTEEKLAKRSATFSYSGTANQPPDAILRNGDAIEVKKVDSLNGNVQLNSSPPKSKLLANDSRINKACRQLAETEGWQEKDMLYAVGSQVNNQLIRLWFAYGDCFAASHDVYDQVSSRITNSIASNFDETELATTNELAGVPKVDPLNLTYLRVRGMWIIQNPSVIFAQHIQESTKNFKAYCVLREEKYYSFNDEILSNFEQSLNDNLAIKDIEILDPDNPESKIKAKLVSYEI
jgi:hypothetical protein